MDWLIRRSLASTPGSGEICPGPEVLAAYYERSLDPSETARCETHLSQCAHCREQLAMMVRAEETPQPVPHRSWLWDWRLLASAAAVLLFLTVWGVRRSVSLRVSSTANEPLVAMSRPEQTPPQQSAPPPGQPVEVAPSAPHDVLVAPQVSDRATARARPAVPEEPSAPRNEIQALPLNGRDYENLLKVKPGAKSANQPSRIAGARKEEAKSVPGAASSPAAPSTMSAQVYPGMAGGTLGAASAAPDANETATADALRAKQMESAPRAKAFGAARSGALAPLAEQRSASTIIQTPDPKVMWRIAGGDFVERTEDGGATWRGQVADPDALLTSGSAPTTKVCWLVGKVGMILVTKDTTHWKKILPPIPADFVSIDAKNGSSATLVAVDGQKFSTDNEGKKWVPVR
jgi:hypothetical protein